MSCRTAESDGSAFVMQRASRRRGALASARWPVCVASRGPFALLKRGELVLEASHRVAVQQDSPAHPGHAQLGQLGKRWRLRQAYDVHRAADLRGEAAQGV